MASPNFFVAEAECKHEVNFTTGLPGDSRRENLRGWLAAECSLQPVQGQGPGKTKANAHEPGRGARDEEGVRSK